MNIAITGHTKGLGRAIVDWFAARGHTVTGFSRSTDHDISLPGTAKQIADSCAMTDVFINNAFFRMAQVDLLYEFYDRWKNDPTKTIINIGSNTGDVTKNFRHPYAVFKIGLDEAVAQLQNTFPACRIMNIRPGYVDTQSISHVVAKKLEPDYVAGLVGWMIEQPCVVKVLTVVS